MNYFEDILYTIVGLWAAIILFVTAPIWVIPYIIYKRIK